MMRLISSDLSSRRKCCSLAVLAFALAATLSISTASLGQATNASFIGTYTLVFGSPGNFNIEYNMDGQEVGFCPNFPALPYGYSCFNYTSAQDVVTGTLVADGNGNFTAGSTYTNTADVNSYTCSSHFNAAPMCPYIVPSGIPWSSTVNYVIGDEVDYNKATYQAVKATLNQAPATSNICSNKVKPPNCIWDLLTASATGTNTSGSGTLSGTYSVQSNGSGVMDLTPSGAQGTASFSIVVPAKTAIGQQIPFAALPTVGNPATGAGAAVRIK